MGRKGQSGHCSGLGRTVAGTSWSCAGSVHTSLMISVQLGPNKALCSHVRAAHRHHQRLGSSAGSKTAQAKETNPTVTESVPQDTSCPQHCSTAQRAGRAELCCCWRSRALLLTFASSTGRFCSKIFWDLFIPETNCFSHSHCFPLPF